jgi:hypothetical protein
MTTKEYRIIKKYSIYGECFRYYIQKKNKSTWETFQEVVPYGYKRREPGSGWRFAEYKKGGHRWANCGFHDVKQAKHVIMCLKKHGSPEPPPPEDEIIGEY